MNSSWFKDKNRTIEQSWIWQIFIHSSRITFELLLKDIFELLLECTNWTDMQFGWERSQDAHVTQGFPKFSRSQVEGIVTWLR